jgi:hypothetical protein
MSPTQLLYHVSVVCLCIHCEFVFAQDSQVQTAVPSTEEKVEDQLTIKIVAEPKISRPYDWKRGERITVGVRCVTEGHTRIVGLATGVELVATRTFKNRVEMMLRGDVDSIKKIETAAKRSEFWFEIMPFKEEHRKTLSDDVDFQEFLRANSKYRAATELDWGWGPNPQLSPPTKDELPTRK